MLNLMVHNEHTEHSAGADFARARAERGDKAVSFANIRKLAEALGTGAEELLHRAPEGGE